MVFDVLSRFFTRDLAVDLGTANTLVFARGEGIVLDEPSIVAVRPADGSLVAVGTPAKAMLGRAPASVSVVRPLKDGVIADLGMAQTMLHAFIARAQGREKTRLRSRVVLGVPSGITQVEVRAVRESALKGGAREVYLVAEPVAAAVGAGMPIGEAGGNLMVTIGGGTTEVAVLSLSGVVHCESLRIGGDEMDAAITQYVRKHHNLLIGERQAEAVKLALGSACPTDEESRKMIVKGRDLVSGFPKTITINEEEVREALREPVAQIVDTVRACLERTPPELAADIVENGITMSGGGALLRGLDYLLRLETNLPVVLAEDPLSGGAPSEPCPQPGDAGAVSDPGLVLDRDDAEAAHQLLLDVVPLVVERGPAEREDRRRHVDGLAVLEPLDERVVARLLHQLGDAIHGALELPLLPLGGAGRAVQDARGPVGIDVELVDRRALRTERALVERAPRIALDVHDLPVDGVHERRAADGAVGADARRGPGGLDPKVLRASDGGPKIRAGREQATERRAGSDRGRAAEEIAPGYRRHTSPLLRGRSNGRAVGAL
jgi:rod shape-determining protein MreB